MLRERAGARELTLELPEGARVRDALTSLGSLAEGMPLVMAVNREYADEDVVLSPDDELALIPPVSGGGVPAEVPMVHVRVTEDPLSAEALANVVRNPAAGAIVVFEGITREVEALEYEAYAEMAEERIAEILAEVKARYVLAVAAGHREEAFAGAREAIDRIKAEAPIWKKELEGGEGRWVEGRLP
jgi:molybdopterin synthase catalytic subunit